MMSMSWKSYLFAVFALALVYQVNAAPPDDVKLISTSGSTNRTTIRTRDSKDIYVEFQLKSNQGNEYKLRDASIQQGKWWFGDRSSDISEDDINRKTFDSDIKMGAVQNLGSDLGAVGSFNVKNKQGTIAMHVEFSRTADTQPNISFSQTTTCAPKLGPEFYIYQIICD
ncbi:uncharacterized protein LOC135835368 [Planococcus citri]|uniref:uncharacterized protein LOC135835368 n=1 Tax=Planococcus citri TaxID=170843 RepID=UPI0031F7DB32